MSLVPSLSPLYGPLFSTATMRDVFAPAAQLQRMLDVEAALAQAEAGTGVIPQGAADTISAACRTELFDTDAIAACAQDAGNLAIPLVKALTETVRQRDADAAGYVHWGATSQDILDTGLVLQLREAVALLDADVARATAGFATLAEKHRTTIAAGRTLMQQALPLPFGLAAAGCAAALARARERLRRAATEAIVLQFGGAVGTLAALGANGLRVTELLGRELNLLVPDAPWHTHRDRLAGLAAAVAILVGTCGKVARDVSLLMQTEVGEAFEPAAAGRGGSSTMPQKRNPVGASVALAAANIAPQLLAAIVSGMVQEHERALGGWQAEWLALPGLFLVASGALATTADIAEGLEVDTDRMHVNLDITGGAIMAEAVMMALAPTLGRGRAHEIVEHATKRAAADKRPLRDALADDADVARYLDAGALDRLFDYASYQGAAQAFIDRLLASIKTQ